MKQRTSGLRVGSKTLRLHVPLVVFTILALANCRTPGSSELSGVDFRQEMRTLVQEISDYGRTGASPRPFFVIPQNGQELLTSNGEASGPAVAAYVDAIDAVGREDLLYGYTDDDVATPPEESSYMRDFLLRARELGLDVLVTDYCSAPAHVDDSYATNAADGFLSFAADSRGLDSIPSRPAAPYSAHDGAVITLSDARNFLYLINPAGFDSTSDLVSTLDSTNYDVFIIDLFDNDGVQLTSQQVTALQSKPGGAARLVIAYMSIGEAEDYRFYWSESYNRHPPSWIEGENPDWPGNYKVRYWDPEWKAILFGSDDAYLDRILAAGFDGVYLDIIDGFEYFEQEY